MEFVIEFMEAKMKKKKYIYIYIFKIIKRKKRERKLGERKLRMNDCFPSLARGL